MSKCKLVTFELFQWQIKIGNHKTVNILIIYRPLYSRGNPYTGFKCVEEFGDFLGDRLNNTNMIIEDFNFHVKDVKDSKNLAFQDLLQSFRPIQHVGCQTHQSGHTLDVIVTKEEDALSVLDLVVKFYISGLSFIYSEIRVNKPHAVRRTIRTRRMRNVEEKEIKKELEEIWEMIIGESSIDKEVRMYNDRVKASFGRIFSRGREKGNS